MKTPTPHSPLTAAQLDALNRFAELLEALCAVVVARLAQQTSLGTFWGRMFGGVSRPLLTRISGELRGVGDAVRAFASAAISEVDAGATLFPPAPCKEAPCKEAPALRNAGEEGGADAPLPSCAVPADLGKAPVPVATARTPRASSPEALASQARAPQAETMTADEAGGTIPARGRVVTSSHSITVDPTDSNEATVRVPIPADRWTKPPAWEAGAAGAVFSRRWAAAVSSCPIRYDIVTSCAAAGFARAAMIEPRSRAGAKKRAVPALGDVRATVLPA